jgi:hypothetical protein
MLRFALTFIFICTGIILWSVNQDYFKENVSDPDTGEVEQVLVHLKNMAQGSQSIPGSNGVVKLESRRYSHDAQTLDAMATFYNVPRGAGYTVSGWYHSAN